MSGFAVVNYWIWMFQLAKGESVDYRKKITRESKVKFNQIVMSLKNKYGYQTGDLMDLIFFMYSHNPLAFPQTWQNGSVKNLPEAALFFERWKRSNEDRIKRDGIRRAMDDTAPVPQTDAERHLLSLMEDLRATYGGQRED